MSAERNEDRWLRVAQAVSNGEPVDWENPDLQTLDREANDVVRALRSLEEIARVHKSAPRSPTGGADAATRTSPDLERWRHLRILQRVGDGTFGAVYRARDEGLDRVVALKLLSPRPGGTPLEPAAVLNEARLLARVSHPNVVTVFGADAVDGRVGIWMELIRGRTLEEVLKAQGPFGAREAAAIGLDLCHALAAVHGAGLLHRDLKCQNVMREEGGRIVLMDFGAGADVAGRAPAARADIAGTPLYLAPELFGAAPPSVAADVYSLGVLLYHLVSGAYPVEGATHQDILEAHLRRERRRLRDARPDLPDAFVRIVERALDYDPHQRYRTPGALADDLAAPLGADRGAGRDVTTPGPEPTPGAKGTGRSWLLAAGLVLVASMAGGGVWWSATSTPRERHPPSPPSQASDDARLEPASLDTASYEIGATFHVVRAAAGTALRAGDRVAPGDRLYLTVQASRPVYLYVINQDERGESYLMFPLPGQSLSNPLPAGPANRIPGPRGGQELYWQVTSAGGREHFFVFASPRVLEAFEQSIATLPRPAIDRPVLSVQLPERTLGTLRGIGGLTTDEAPAGLPRAFPFATALLDQAEITHGFWARQIAFDNPAR